MYTHVDGCTDKPTGFYDLRGLQFNCMWYANDDNCNSFQDQDINLEGYGLHGNLTASVACCACAPSRSPGSGDATPGEAYRPPSRAAVPR